MPTLPDLGAPPPLWSPLRLPNTESAVLSQDSCNTANQHHMSGQGALLLPCSPVVISLDCCSVPRQRLPDKIQDAQLNLNFREATNSFPVYVCSMYCISYFYLLHLATIRSVSYASASTTALSVIEGLFWARQYIIAGNKNNNHNIKHLLSIEQLYLPDTALINLHCLC